MFKNLMLSLQSPKSSHAAGASPIVIVDVGCRWGFAERFTSYECLDTFKVFGFDPDKEECSRLQAAYAHLPTGFVSCVPIGLAGSNGKRNLYLTKEPGCSSLHPPIQFLADEYPALDCIKLQNVISTSVVTLDTWASDNNLSSIDYIKIDTQGSELEILKGGDRIIETTRCIDVEVEFNPIYQGQSLFAETDLYLRSKGFILWRLSNLVHYSIGGKELRMPDKMSICFDTNVRHGIETYGGQLFWADATYIHKDVLLARQEESKAFERDVRLFTALSMPDVLDHMKRAASQD